MCLLASGCDFRRRCDHLKPIVVTPMVAPGLIAVAPMMDDHKTRHTHSPRER
jgi:hypothetical protein